MSLAILGKLNHFNAHVRQLHIHPEGGKERPIQRQSSQNMHRSKSSESQTTIPNRTHGDPDIAHFINTFLKTCRRYPRTTSDPMPVIDLLWAQPFWTRRHCYGAITADSEPSLHAPSLQLTLFNISHYFNPDGGKLLEPQPISVTLPLNRLGPLLSPTGNVLFPAAISEQIRLSGRDGMKRAWALFPPTEDHVGHPVSARVWGLGVGTLPAIGFCSADESVASSRTWVRAKM